ncbi:putative histidine-type phosphatase [Paratrimastix pyriformis]|uniref:Histidine-type phosphatase n=1 Tax=Paratrimastix pyriformis TaxID=342808 RepID=A0ABQ8UYQ0_9EUKA|nr:putative histidine-type phosphatase [Paratrimastix pyriformis]
MSCFLRFLFLFCLARFALGGLVSVTLVTRHGDRTGLHVVPQMENPWPILGQLTGTGMRQHYDLGVKIRARYASFIPDVFNTSAIALRSTSVERTLQSAESLLQGLFPEGSGPVLPDGNSSLPHQIQVFPIMSSQKDDDFVMRSYDICPRVEAMRVPLVYQAPDWIAAMQANSDLLDLLANLSGFDRPMAVEHFNWVADYLLCRRQQGLGLYPGVTDEIYDRTISLHSWIQTRKFPSDRAFCRASIGPFVAELLSNWKSDLAHKADARLFRLYSAHDTTLIALMTALKSPIPAPYYASHTLFELYASDEAHASPYVRVLYNFQPCNIPGCGAADCP